jgi:hypothetical protein
MKKVIAALALCIAVSGAAPSYAFSPAAKKTKKHATATKFTCSMHPEVVKSKPGKCPKCGMALIPMKPKNK